MTDAIKRLEHEVRRLHDIGAYHKRRGFQLSKSTKLLCSNHLLEESAELQAEACITEDYDATVEEAGDVMATFLHLLYLCGTNIDAVAERCLEKLKTGFTTDPREIDTATPGFTRRSRE